MLDDESGEWAVPAHPWRPSTEMSEIFEELVAREMDRLYQCALFLHSGDERNAEAFLLQALTDAFRAFPERPPGGEPAAWLHGLLVATFLRRAGQKARLEAGVARPATHAALPPARALERLRPEALIRAARGLAPLERAALWLVVCQRWHYAEACEALGIGREELGQRLRVGQARLLGALSLEAGTEGQSSSDATSLN